MAASTAHETGYATERRERPLAPAKRCRAALVVVGHKRPRSKGQADQAAIDAQLGLCLASAHECSSPTSARAVLDHGGGAVEQPVAGRPCPTPCINRHLRRASRR